VTGQRQLARFIREHRDGAGLDPDRFERTGGGKVRCSLCHRTGYGTSGPVEAITCFDGRVIPWHARFSPWQVACLMPHDWHCSCGLRFIQFAYLWRHIGAPRPANWGRQGVHRAVLEMAVR
jgi:hypothetical protein